MGYYIQIKGSFFIDPAVDISLPAFQQNEFGGWRISPNRRLLYLPEGTHLPDPFSALKQACDTLRQSGHTVSGEVSWRGEDESQGMIQIHNNLISIIEDPIESLSETEIARLVEQMKTGDEAAVCEALEVLDYFAIASEEVLQILSESLHRPSLKIRMKAANSLGHLGEKAASKIEELIQALKDEEPWMRAAAAEALGEIGRLAESAIPYLTQLLDEPNYGPSGRAKEAISKIQAAETGRA